MANIKVKIPYHSKVRDIVKDTYTKLYNERKAAMPNDKGYTRKQLTQNINNVTSINNKEINVFEIRNSTFDDWVAKGWKQIYYSHWYFAIIVKRDGNNGAVAEIQDAHYEGEHHNDELHGGPYDSMNESLKQVLSLIERIDKLD